MTSCRALSRSRALQMTPQPIKTSFGYHLILVVRLPAAR